MSQHFSFMYSMFMLPEEKLSELCLCRLLNGCNCQKRKNHVSSVLHASDNPSNLNSSGFVIFHGSMSKFAIHTQPGQ